MSTDTPCQESRRSSLALLNSNRYLPQPSAGRWQSKAAKPPTLSGATLIPRGRAPLNLRIPSRLGPANPGQSVRQASNDRKPWIVSNMYGQLMRAKWPDTPAIANTLSSPPLQLVVLFCSSLSRRSLESASVTQILTLGDKRIRRGLENSPSHERIIHLPRFPGPTRRLTPLRNRPLTAAVCSPADCLDTLARHRKLRAARESPCSTT